MKALESSKWFRMVTLDETNAVPRRRISGWAMPLVCKTITSSDLQIHAKRVEPQGGAS